MKHANQSAFLFDTILLTARSILHCRRAEMSSSKGPRGKNAEQTITTDPDEDLSSAWGIVPEVASRVSVPHWAARNAIDLLDQDHTIPFIARYRKEKTGNMEADKLRDLKDVYEELK